MVNNVLPRLVTFDVTGTLLMTKLVENYSKIGLQHGVKISNSRELAGSFKRNFKQLAKEHPNFGRHSGLGWENWWRQIVYNVFKDQDERVSDETLDKVRVRNLDIRLSIPVSFVRFESADFCWGIVSQIKRKQGGENL